MLERRDTIVYLKRNQLPQHLQECMKEWMHYQDGRYGKYIDLPSEFAGDYGSLSMEVLKQWYEEQKTRNSNLTFVEFIKQWGLEFELWLATNHAEELKGVEEILIQMK